jgi:threonine synthase
LVFSCPSGIFWNICAGIIAKKMGLPIAHLSLRLMIPYPFLENESTTKTIQSHDFKRYGCNQSNFIRIQEMYNNGFGAIQSGFFVVYLTDDETIAAMKTIYAANGYIAEPHGYGISWTEKN